MEQKRVGFDERALNNKLSDFAKQMSSLRDAITSLGTLEISSGDDDRGYEGPSPKPEIDLPPSILGSNIVKHQEGRLSFDSISSDVSDSILSPLAALNRQAFLQNQQMTGTPYRPGDNTLGTAALSLRLADMQRKHDEVLVHWDNAMGQIVYLKCELERHIHSNFDGHGIERTGDLTPKFDSYDEEIGAREAVIDVLKAQNESLQEMISQRVTIMGYTDSNLDARSIGKQLLEKTERTNRQQEEIDLLKWRLQGEQSSLREQLQVNRILDDEVKSTKRRQENDAIWKRSRRHDSLAPDSRPRQELLAEDSAMMERHRPSSLASNSTITSFLGKLDMYSTMRTQTTFLEDRGKPRRNFHSSRSSNLYPKEVL